MATNNRDYMRFYAQMRRARLAGYNADLAVAVYRELLRRGVDKAGALWAVIDASRRGCFGDLRRRAYQWRAIPAR